MRGKGVDAVTDLELFNVETASEANLGVVLQN